MGEFVGKRVVPDHVGIWEQNKTYEPLMIVLDNVTGDSYISRRAVPAGISLSDESYWSLCAHYSAQMKKLEQDVDADVQKMHSDMAATKTAMSKELTDTHTAMSQELSQTERRVKENLQQTSTELTTQVEQAKSDLNTGRQELKDAKDTLNKRMDSIAGGKTSNAEILDARVGASGKTYDNLGAHLRAMGGEVLDYLEEEGFQRGKRTVIDGNEITETFPSGKSKKTVMQGTSVTESWFSKEGVLLVSKVTSFEGNSILETVEEQSV